MGPFAWSLSKGERSLETGGGSWFDRLTTNGLRQPSLVAVGHCPLAERDESDQGEQQGGRSEHELAQVGMMAGAPGAAATRFSIAPVVQSYCIELE